MPHNLDPSQYSFPPDVNAGHEPAADIKELILMHKTPDVSTVMTRLMLVFLLFSAVFMIIIPWQQTSTGTGRVIAYLPQDRVQNIHASVSGRINKWYVREGTYVKKGDPIVEIIDIDPQFMERLKVERLSSFQQYEAAKGVASTAKYDFDRQTSLYGKGISSRKDMEQAIIAYKGAQAAEALAQANLMQVDSRLSRQKTQLIEAPVDGTVLRLVLGTSSVVVAQGQVMAVFVPKNKQPAVEILIPGNDLPLVRDGRRVRLQFEGWPAVQFSGWPSVAIGTFGGEVALVEQNASHDGLFRIIIVPGPKDQWPDLRFIRQGTRVNGWILLNKVSLGFELWRQFNGFPPSLDKGPIEITNTREE